ncbi:YciI family protein [Reichenbachiella sp.]|uniref:YciI family protein n=1 Tax=Reichenbachiella sp. TaxID=2184521 RepID=UPI003B590A48
MYIISLTYKVPLENIDQHLADHVAFLNAQYEQGYFLMSGKKIPRIGGIILAIAKSKEEVSQWIEKDPFHIHQLADYEVIEFEPTKSTKELEYLLD